MKNKFKKINLKASSVLVFGLMMFTPLVIFAQDGGLAGFFKKIQDLLTNSIVPVIFALAFVFFIWGVVQYVLYPDDEGKKEKGRQYMVWGLIALTVMFSVWGLVKILGGTFDILDKSSPTQPKLPG